MSMFKWSPDGQRIVFESSYEDESHYGKDGTHSSAIYTTTIEEKTWKRLTDISGLDNDPAWSPDGQHIAFSSNRSGNQDIYVMSSSGTDVKRLTADPGDHIYPIWSPDGRRIAFLSDQGVKIMDADGRNQVRITPEPTFGPLHWTPDGHKIIYSSIYSSGQDVWVVGADGKDQKNLTGGLGWNLDVSLTPDGKSIVFRSNRTGNWDIFSINIDGSNLKNLTNSPTDELFPSCLP
jgi:TolB protein